jgi:hypothetical protein
MKTLTALLITLALALPVAAQDDDTQQCPRENPAECECSPDYDHWCDPVVQVPLRKPRLTLTAPPFVIQMRPFRGLDDLIYIGTP